MNLFTEFSRRAPSKVFASILLGALAGILYSLLIPLVLSVLQLEDPRFETVVEAPTRFLSLEVANAPFALVFTLVCLLILLARTLSQVTLARLAIDVASELRTRMYDRIARAPLAAIESIGPARLIATLSADVPRIVAGARMLPDLLINAVTLVGMLGFLLLLNSDVFWFVLGCIAVGVLTYQIPVSIGQRYFVRARRELDELQESIHGLIEGFKELKLGNEKRAAYFDRVLLAHEKQVCASEKTGYTVVRAANSYGDLISFFVIGSIMFVFVNYHVVSNQELVGVVMALLYITGPVAIILNFVPQLAVSRVSLERVKQLLREIPEENIDAQQQPASSWRRIRFEQVTYRHHSAQGREGFQIGPINLEFQRGEITFVVGGNGSGKSTLSKLLTLHYPPEQGTIYFGDQAIGSDTLESCRQSISAIYSDYHLFNQVFGVEEEGLTQTVRHYLRALRLDSKVTFSNGRFSTLTLSDGQRRRLALLTAIIEDRSLYVFDEWAADQDPAFKEVFYREILPLLKSSGKAVVVITHDDRYFDLADRVVVMEDGKVSRVETNAASDASSISKSRATFELAG